ncbi:unnamed protein product [Clonostachys rosea f. rosea IK726]|uniref:Methyltransferase type 11 domain-containing protein n=2 Tax=Bionectria ochroleuca TaxID=29856 RepID=A0A0B7KQZ5_BIOOC|nr:unnamed protein product [Clonostachys rosea f. rosea IK726]
MTESKDQGKQAAEPGGDKAKVETTRLKKRIQKHYNVTSDLFLKVWGEHIHQGYYKSPTDTDAQAQINQVLRLVESSGVAAGSRILDVGCGIGGTARYLARELGCKVTGITNSERQVEIARRLMVDEVAKLGSSSSSPSTDFVQYPSPASAERNKVGAVRILHLDFEQMREYLGAERGEKFDCVWVSEVVFHLHGRKLFFDSASALLEPGGCIVVADMFRTAEKPLASAQKELDSISRNHMCPQLGTVDEYTQMARGAGLSPRHEPIDITKSVAKTWDTTLPLGSLLYAISQGRDSIGYLRGMRSMKRAYSHETASYTILCYEKRP